MKTIEENNRLIAEFMGLSYCTKYTYEGWYKNHEHNQRICDFDGLKYHSSWDWLMLVVEKIENLDNEEGEWDCQFEILKGVCNIILLHGDPAIQTFDDSKIQATYQAVIQFIEWYNSQS